MSVPANFNSLDGFRSEHCCRSCDRGIPSGITTLHSVTTVSKFPEGIALRWIRRELIPS